ncbi:hypothetical protein EYF80_034633 [Liparis tanakae]|uniref:Uncharacterized protein n=1 Tax=Liparis tanakae TaxID=230148 RepID=A0A4Z2GNH0_9TELE|nr:hypothetical protein EYF80_034633 [Liparis tanakae]
MEQLRDLRLRGSRCKSANSFQAPAGPAPPVPSGYQPAPQQPDYQPSVYPSQQPPGGPRCRLAAPAVPLVDYPCPVGAPADPSCRFAAPADSVVVTRRPLDGSGSPCPGAGFKMDSGCATQGPERFPRLRLIEATRRNFPLGFPVDPKAAAAFLISRFSSPRLLVSSVSSSPHLLISSCLLGSF